MGKFYALQIKRGKLALADVPERWREAAEKSVGLCR